MFLACGRADQGADTQRPLEPDDRFSEADAQPIPAQDPHRSEPAPGVSAPTEPFGPIADQGPPEEPETVNPPTQVTGTYMNARVLAETELTVDIGLTAYHKGLRVQEHPESFSAIWSVSQAADPQVSATLMPSGDGAQDMILRVSGESLKAVRAQFPLISVMLQVKDLKLSKNDTQLNQAVLSILQETTNRGSEPAQP